MNSLATIEPISVEVEEIPNEPQPEERTEIKLSPAFKLLLVAGAIYLGMKIAEKNK